MNSGAIYTTVVINDPFNPGSLAKVFIDTNDVASASLVGHGVLDGIDTPIMRLTYKNGTKEDLFDVDGFWNGVL